MNQLLSYKGRVWIERLEEEPGIQFVEKKRIRTGLRPHRVGNKWRIPVITKWNIALRWDSTSYEAFFIVTVGGEYERTFELKYDDGLPVDYDYHREGEVQALGHFEQVVAWAQGEEEEEPVLPDLLTEWSDDNLAIWVTGYLIMQATIRQAHVAPNSLEGYFMPQGWIETEITYYWKTVDTYEFEARRKK